MVKQRSVIRQSVVLGAPAESLFAMYLDPRRHGAITGMPGTISRKPGSVFGAFGGSLSGRLLATVTPRLIVQSWRSTGFGKHDPDSTLVLAFSPVDKGKGRIDLLHLDVPKIDYRGVTEGWKLYYWQPWRRYLAQRR
jgi:activator of HSP90 ATPase